jgi:hypothetical protein
MDFVRSILIFIWIFPIGGKCMNAKKIFQMLVVVILLASSPMAAQQQQPNQGNRNSDYHGYVTGNNNGYIVEWPYPQVGDRPSHYPPYYRDTQ